MDLGSRLANLSLAEIASMLNTKQQEVLLASISVAARFIQQLQAEEQIQQQAEEQQLMRDNNNTSANSRLHQQLLHNNGTTTTTTTTPTTLTGTSEQKRNHHSNTAQQLRNDRLQAEEQYRLQAEEQDRLEAEEQDRLLLLEEQHDQDQSSDISFDDDDYSSSADRQTLLTIREFAEELKHRRKSIRLSQKGAAQSLRAFTSGEQPCTDAIIYHFENLQLEPDRAMQLIPLLKDWLEWAEKHRLNGKQLPMMSAVTKVPRERKRKVVLFNEKAKQYLEDAFLKNNHPDRYQLDVISQELNIPTRSIRKWFTNRRQRKRFAEKFSPVS